MVFISEALISLAPLGTVDLLPNISGHAPEDRVSKRPRHEGREPLAIRARHSETEF